MKYMTSIFKFALLVALCESVVGSAQIAYPKNLKLSNPSLEAAGKTAAALDNSLPEAASFQLEIDGKSLAIDLKKSELFALDFVESILDVDEEGSGLVKESVAMSTDVASRNCYYEGRVVGDDRSLVSLDVCSGVVRGAIHTKDSIYSVDDIPAANKNMLTNLVDAIKSMIWTKKDANEHINVAMAFEKGFNVKDVKEEFTKLTDSLEGDQVHDHDKISSNSRIESLQYLIAKAEGEEEKKEETTNTEEKKEENATPAPPTDETSSTTEEETNGLGPRPKRYVEVLLFSDAARVKQLGADLSSDTKRIFHMMHTYYKNAPTKLELNLVLKGSLMFKKDPYWIPTVGGGAQMLGNRGLLLQFLNHVGRMRGAYPSYDLTLLLSGRQFQSNIRGLANVGAVCDVYNAGGVNSVTYSNPLMNAALAAHEAGHILGANHDSQPGAMRCSDQLSIMQPMVMPATQFSSCSIKYFDDFLHRATCLYNNPMQQTAVDDENQPQPLQLTNLNSPPPQIAPSQDSTNLTNFFVICGIFTCVAIGLCAAIAITVAKRAAVNAVKQAALDSNNTTVNTTLPQVVYLPSQQQQQQPESETVYTL